MINQPANRPIGKRKYRLTEDFFYTLPKWLEAELKLTTETIAPFFSVLEGSVNDGASVNRIAWTTTGIRPDGLIRAAALVHDFLYIQKGVVTDIPAINRIALIGSHASRITLTRKQVDRLFYHMMIESGMGKVKAKLAYFGVRWFAKLGGRW